MFDKKCEKCYYKYGEDMKHIKKYLRFYIMFGVTAILSIYLIFWGPTSKYLAVYKNKMTIEYDIDLKDGYSWSFESDNDNVKLSSSEDNKWVFEPNKNGNTTLTFYYKNEDNTLYKIIYGLKVLKNKIIWTKGEGTGLTSYPNPY